MMSGNDGGKKKRNMRERKREMRSSIVDFTDQRSAIEQKMSAIAPRKPFTVAMCKSSDAFALKLVFQMAVVLIDNCFPSV